MTGRTVTIRAAVCRDFGQPLTIEHIDLAPPGPGEVRVRLGAVAICHSDIFYAQGAWGGTLPAVFGHEAAGIVEEVGPGVTHLAPGDHAVVTLIRYCGTCPNCAEGSQVLCETVFPLDRASPLTKSGAAITHGLRTGAFAEQVVVEASQAVAIDKSVPLDAASLIACGVITGVGAVINTAGVTAGKSVAVIGCGGVGLNAVQGARLAGASPIVAIDISDAKLDAARRFGATHTINSRHHVPAEALADITGGRKLDYAFITAGAPKLVEQALTLIRRNGAAVVVGMPASGVMASFDPGWLAADGQRILGSKMGSTRPRTDIPKIVELYQQGRIKLDELISGRYALENINEAIADVLAGSALRNVIVF